MYFESGNVWVYSISKIVQFEKDYDKNLYCDRLCDLFRIFLVTIY
jgi:hypothetical protein